MDGIIFAAREVGSRPATRVRIVSTPEQPTCFAGLTGVVSRVHDDGNVFVRLHLGGREVELPFGRSSLEERGGR